MLRTMDLGIDGRCTPSDSLPVTPISEEGHLASADHQKLTTITCPNCNYTFYQIPAPPRCGPYNDEKSIPREYRHAWTERAVLRHPVFHLRNCSSEFVPSVEDSPNLGDARYTNSEDLEKEAINTSPDSDQRRDDEDANLVDWEGPADPENPMNWPKGKKSAAVYLTSLITLITPLASSMVAPGVPQLMREFGSSDQLLASFVVSVYLLGFVFGPLVCAPASELVGRVPVYHLGNVTFLIFTIACAVSSDLPMFCVFRFLQGTAGAVPLTIGGATIGDIMPPEKRGGALAIWGLGPLLGPVIGPVIGGFLSEAKGWRWVFWLLAIISGTLTIASFLLLKETYAPILLSRKTKRLRRSANNPRLRSKLDTGLPPREFFRRAVIRPMKLLTRSPIVILMCLNISIVFSYLYLLFTTFTYVFEEQYGFSTGTAGLSYLGIGMGMFVGLGFAGKGSDVILRRKKAQNNGVLKPEYRLPILVLGPPLTAVGLFGYGWSAEARVHWIAPIMLTSLVGLGLIASYLPTQAYFIDAFGRYAASAVAANTLTRSLLGAMLPLAGQPMYTKLGLGWGNSVLAFIALAMAPVPFLFLKYGERIRTSKRFELQL